MHETLHPAWQRERASGLDGEHPDIEDLHWADGNAFRLAFTAIPVDHRVDDTRALRAALVGWIWHR